MNEGAERRSLVSNFGTTVPSCLTTTSRIPLTGCCDSGIGTFQAWKSMSSANCAGVKWLSADWSEVLSLHASTSAKAITTNANATMRFFIKRVAPERSLLQAPYPERFGAHPQTNPHIRQQRNRQENEHK